MKHDTLEKRGVLMSAQDIAQSAKGTVAPDVKTLDGRRGAIWRLSGAAEEILDIPIPSIDDPEVNWLGMWMYLSEERPFLVFWINLRTDRWPEGWHTAECFYSSHRGDWKGWRYLQWPMRDFGLHGDPESYSNLAAVRISCVSEAVSPHLIKDLPAPEVALGELEFGVLTYPEGPRISTDELLADLTIELPQDRSADQALLEHFSRRGSAPFRPFASTTHDEKAVAAADRLVEQNLWRSINLSHENGVNPWLYRPGIVRDDDDDWYYLQANTFLTDLCSAHEQTGQVHYLEKGRDLLLEWIRTYPVPEATDGGRGYLWGGLSPGGRAYRWLAAYHTFLEAGMLSPEQHTVFLRAFWDMTHNLDSYPFHGYNFALFREAALLLLTVEFPEFASFRTLQDKVIGIINEELDLELGPDGFQNELSTGYQTCIARVAEVMAHARRTGRELDVPFKDLMERAFEVWLNLSRPDGTSVSVNDAGPHDSDYRDILKGGAEIFGRDDFLYVATCGEQGARPGHNSFMYPYAGYCVIRSGWDTDDRFLMFDGGPVGINHRHEDKLSFDLYAYGQRFIVDPGIHKYGENDYSRFFGSTRAHNTITVDGLGQKRADNPAYWTVDEPLDNLWHHGEVLQIVQASFDAPYRTATRDPRAAPEQLNDIVHTRTVLFARPDYFVLLDKVTGAGEHTCEAFFHFAPIEVDLQPDGSARAVGTNGAALHLIPLLTEQLQAEKIVGATDPVQGWVVIKEGRSPVEAPVVLHRKAGPLPQRFLTVLYPLSADDAHLQPACVLMHEDDTGVSFTVETPDRTDEWHVAFLNAYHCRQDGLDWNGKALLITKRPDGARRVAAANAQRLILDGEPLIESFTEFAER